jgi:hypothetical protein
MQNREYSFLQEDAGVMKRRPIKVALSVIGFGFVAVLVVLTLDAAIAVNRMNPVPAAETAAKNAGWKTETIQLKSVDASGGLFGSSAIVNYRLDENNDSEQLEVHLRRPLFSRHWMPVRVNSK